MLICHQVLVVMNICKSQKSLPLLFSDLIKSSGLLNGRISSGRGDRCFRRTSRFDEQRSRAVWTIFFSYDTFDHLTTRSRQEILELLKNLQGFQEPSVRFQGFWAADCGQGGKPKPERNQINGYVSMHNPALYVQILFDLFRSEGNYKIITNSRPGSA